MNTLTSFQNAKLLKEKGFDEPCPHSYKELDSPVLYAHQDKKYNNSHKKEWQNTVRRNSKMNNAVINIYSAPTIAEVVMWLYEKHGIWIVSSYELNIETHKKEWFWIAIKDGEEIAYQYVDFNSPTEAYSAGVEYCLTKLL